MEWNDTTLDKEGAIGAYTLGSIGVVDWGTDRIGVGSHWKCDENKGSGSLLYGGEVVPIKSAVGIGL